MIQVPHVNKIKFSTNLFVFCNGNSKIQKISFRGKNTRRNIENHRKTSYDGLGSNINYLL